VKRPSLSRWLLLAAPPGAASAVMLALAGVGRATWVMQLTAMVAAAVLALGVRRLTASGGASAVARAALMATIVAVSLPLLRTADGPTRWVSLGGTLLYVAPVVLPSAIASFDALLLGSRGARGDARLALAFAPLAAVALALQPDASQLLALLLACGVSVWRQSCRTTAHAASLAAIALLAAWSFTRPDPLLPIPHVEGVFALALGRSIVAGIAVIAGACALVLGVARRASATASWPPAVATYYATLFACSVAGLTPAPLIGYGAGPWLGFGLLAGVAAALEEAHATG